MKREEDAIQKAVVDHLNIRGVDGLVWFHVPNGGARSKIEAARFKRMGVRPGVSDLILYHDCTLYALELKAGKNKPTKAQEAFIDAVNGQGGNAAVATGLDEAIEKLEFWGLLRGAA